MYKFHNANPLNRFEDDCTIRAISCATGKSWDCVYDELSDLAQIKGTMMDNKDFIIDYLDTRYRRVPYLPNTVGETADRYVFNILLITMNGHICCSKYGIIYDTFDPRDRFVEEAWIVV
jgi:hypothetical protein